MNYVILCLGSTVHGDKINVRAFRTGDIRKQLEKQHVKIYEYAGDDCLLAGFQSMHKDISVTPSAVSSGENFDISVKYARKDLRDGLLLDFIHYAVKKAHYAIQNQIPYITTLRVQMFMETFSEHIIGWESVAEDKEKWRVRPQMRSLDQDTIEQKMNDFAQRWVSQSKAIATPIRLIEKL